MSTCSVKVLFIVFVLSLAEIGISRDAYAWQIGTPPAAFDVVAKRVLSMKNCKQRDRITFAGLIDDGTNRLSLTEAASKIKKKGVVLIMVDSDRGGDESFLFGPLSQVPSKQQLDGLLGKEICVY